MIKNIRSKFGEIVNIVNYNINNKYWFAPFDIGWKNINIKINSNIIINFYTVNRKFEKIVRNKKVPKYIQSSALTSLKS